MTAAGGLGRFLNGPARPQQRLGEACEMCGVAIPDEHRHVVNLENRRLLCACTPCSLLFTQAGAGRGNFRAVPDRYAATDITPEQWEQLQVPVAMAFFFVNSALGRVVAQYPSPAGATESLLDLAAWDAITAANPVASALEADVEALIVRRDRSGEVRAFLVPIDACYELVGALRMHWTGFDGGPEAQRDIDAFFERAEARSRPLAEAAGG